MIGFWESSVGVQRWRRTKNKRNSALPLKRELSWKETREWKFREDENGCLIHLETVFLTNGFC